MERDRLGAVAGLAGSALPPDRDLRIEAAKREMNERSRGNQTEAAGPDPFYDRPKATRTPLRERLHATVYQTEQQMHRARAAQRMLEILDKYPEFGELLELKETFGF